MLASVLRTTSRRALPLTRSLRLPSTTAPFRRWNSNNTNNNDKGPTLGSLDLSSGTGRTKLDVPHVPAKLQITFTCTAPATDHVEPGKEEVEKCGERSTHTFTRHAYEKGIVLIQCPGCKNRHLIADHLGWFEGSGGKTIEEIVKARGEKVKRGLLFNGEYVPSPEDDVNAL